MAIVGAGIGLVQLVMGAAEKAKAQKAAAAALAKRKAYKTPNEAYKQLNALEQKAQSGFDPATLDYLTSQTDRSFDASLSTSERLGGDPNDFSLLFNNKVNNIMGIATQDHQIRTQNFSQYINALGALGQSKDAEFFSQQNMVKDEQQKAAVDLANSSKQISEGLNTGISSLAAIGESLLYKDEKDKDKKKKK